jgi:hypothetical protein
VIGEQGSGLAADHGSQITDHKSNSTPGVGIMTSESGSSLDNVARIHSTAGGSPCTRTILRGEIFLAYSINVSRVACALN